MKLRNLVFLLAFGLIAALMGGVTVYAAMPEPIRFVEECVPAI